MNTSVAARTPTFAESPPENSWRADMIGGVTTFLTMSYVVVVNPTILASATGMPFDSVLTATVVLTATMTALMGLYAKIPFAVAPGMGLNAFFAYTVVLGRGVPWPTALGLVFWAGVLFIIFSLTPLRYHLALAIPLHLRSATAVGIGIFLAFLGFKNSGIVVSHPNNFVQLGFLNVQVLLAILGLFFLVYLMNKKYSFSFLVSIGMVTLLAWLLGLIKTPERIFATPHLDGTFLKLDFLGALKPSLLPTAIVILFTDLFDSLSTIVGVSQATGLVDKDGQPKNLHRGLFVDALATLFAGILGTSSGTAYIESAAGIEAGGRTGRAAVVTSLCFIPCLLLAPLVSVIPSYAVAPVLILVGVMMVRPITQLPFDRIEDALPTFLTLVLIPLTFSIADGILWGFLAHGILYALAGRARDVKPVMWIVVLLSLVLLILNNVKY